MALWNSKDEANNAPKYAVAGGYGVSANGETLYQNVKVSAYVTNTAIGVFGVDTTEQSVVANPKGGHAGWVLRKAGTGPITTITANTGAYSPDGNVYIKFAGGGTSNVTGNAQIFTNSVTKQITNIVLNNGGEYTLTPTATATNANAVFTITMGGRANRVQIETLVAMGSMGTDGSSDDDNIFADS